MDEQSVQEVPRRSGIAIPVFSLKSRQSFGTGEFLDLPLLGQWCRKTGIELIQILPVNDTGWDNSPYSALSAFALNPLFIRLQKLPGFEKIKESESLQQELNKPMILKYKKVRQKKLEVCEEIYHNLKNAITPEIEKWLEQNTWARNYALFSLLRRKNDYRHWREWKDFITVNRKDLERLWSVLEEEASFYIWLQYHLEQQLKDASDQLTEMGIILKGDLPILMNEDSCDVWTNKEIFHLDFSAGAPPDMYSQSGQNWGFPTYNWEKIKENGFNWWKDRIVHASRFYGAYRIDHVLGFFRIWSIPKSNHSAILGYFRPFSYIKRSELTKLGFDKSRIKWLSQPHIPGHEIKETLGKDNAKRIKKKYLNRIGSEDLYLFKPEYSTEKAITQTAESPEIEAFLTWSLQNVALIPVEKDLFFPTWNHTASRSYQTLSDNERFHLEALIRHKYAESEFIWENLALEILAQLKKTTDMIVCAEDLGAVPKSVPQVLKKLKINSLKVVPWAKEYDQENQPFTPLEDYPEYSVCTTSVHDSNTMREWLKGENEQVLRNFFQLGQEMDLESKKAYEAILKKVMTANSCWVILPLQDMLTVTKYSSKDPRKERINIPGTVSNTNWSYRIKPLLEDFLEDRKVIDKIKEITSLRKDS